MTTADINERPGRTTHQPKEGTVTTPKTQGIDWALRLCPMCRRLIVLHGTGEHGDPVMFPQHGNGDCLDHNTPAATVINAMIAAGADTADQVGADPALGAATLRIIRSEIAGPDSAQVVRSPDPAERRPTAR